MGRRKSRKPPPAKIRPKVPTVFDCPFCNNDMCIHCLIDKKSGLGTLQCRMCGVKYQTAIHSLSEPIDVYGEWIDECEAENKKVDETSRDVYEERAREGPTSSSSSLQRESQSQPQSPEPQSPEPNQTREEASSPLIDEDDESPVAESPLPPKPVEKDTGPVSDDIVEEDLLG